MAIPVGKGLAEQKYCNIMRLVIQRVCRASVAIKGEAVSEIGNGLLVLVGVETGDRRGYAVACGQDCGIEDIQ